MLVLAIVSLLVPLGVSLRDRVDAEVRLQARSEAEVVAARASAHVSPVQARKLATLARNAASAVRGRVVIVSRGGRIVADSAGTETLGTAYASRPEIAAALRGDLTQVQRQSATLDEEILATAAPILANGRREGAVRITQSVAAVNDAVRRTWLGLGLIGALVLGLGLIAGAYLSRRVSRPILRLNDAAEKVGAGDLTVRAQVEGSAEQQTLARTFNTMTERLATLLAAQTDFVADASHQLRTPLAGLRLHLEDVRGTVTTDEERRSLDACLHETDRLAGIVNELLELSRAGEGHQEVATADPAAALQRAARRFAAPAAQAGCDLRVVAPPPGGRVVCHPSDLDRILDILLENALAYAPGTVVELKAQADEVRVRDHGPGLDRGEEEAVFERFHRGRAGRAGPPGTGLGLAIARDLALRWGGDITVAATPGGGVTATVRLPSAAQAS